MISRKITYFVREKKIKTFVGFLSQMCLIVTGKSINELYRNLWTG